MILIGGLDGDYGKETLENGSHRGTFVYCALSTVRLAGQSKRMVSQSSKEVQSRVIPTMSARCPGKMMILAYKSATD